MGTSRAAAATHTLYFRAIWNEAHEGLHVPLQALQVAAVVQSHTHRTQLTQAHMLNQNLQRCIPLTAEAQVGLHSLHHGWGSNALPVACVQAHIRQGW